MISISEKSTVKESNDYHIKIVGATALMRTEARCRDVINSFLDVLFTLDFLATEIEDEPEDAPLEFSRHSFEAAAPTSILLVELKLKNGTNQTFDEVSERFCKLMFDPRAKGCLQLLTPFGLLGTSALPGPFRKYWIQTCFMDCIVHGPRLISRIDSSYDGGYLPEWALALGFAVLNGLNFEVFAAGSSVAGSFNPISVFGPLCISIVSSFLQKYTPLAAHEAEWKSSHDNLISTMKVVSFELQEATDIRRRDLTSHSHQLQEHYNLCDALYEATVSAAKTFTSNKDILKTFIKLRNDAATNSVHAGLATAVALTHLGSAFSLVTTSQALPLASWGLADVAAVVTTGQLPVLLTTAVGVAWPIAIVAGGVSAIMGVKGYLSMHEKQKFQIRVRYHQRMNTAIVRVWSLAHDTHTLLRWIHTTGATLPNAVDFVDTEARAEWAKFIQSIRAVAGEPFTSADLGPRMVLTYLTEQGQSLEKLLTELSEVA